MQKTVTFFTFEGCAKEAMDYYLSIFPDSQIDEMKTYTNDKGEEKVLHAIFTLCGQQYMTSDSYIKHKWSITPGVSIYVRCQNDDEIQTYFDKLSQGGKVLMPLDSYDFSEKFAWVEDQFKVSWQLNME